MNLSKHQLGIYFAHRFHNIGLLSMNLRFIELILFIEHHFYSNGSGKYFLYFKNGNSFDWCDVREYLTVITSSPISPAGTSHNLETLRPDFMALQHSTGYQPHPAIVASFGRVGALRPESRHGQSLSASTNFWATNKQFTKPAHIMLSSEPIDIVFSLNNSQSFQFVPCSKCRRRVGT